MKYTRFTKGNFFPLYKSNSGCSVEEMSRNHRVAHQAKKNKMSALKKEKQIIFLSHCCRLALLLQNKYNFAHSCTT